MDYKSSISNIFSVRKNLFAVPNYQRAYSWEKDKHITQFFKDIKEHPETVKQYHLGHFLFEADETNENKFWIIDGQQRLTSVVIFLSCIYNKLKDIPEYLKIAQNIYNDYLINSDEEQKYSTVDYDNNFFQNIVISGIPDKDDTRSRKKIKEAFDYFSSELNKKNVTIEEIIKWKNLIENAKITTDKVFDKSEATQLFTFQNDRGKDLTELEKLKSFLMFNVYLDCTILKRNPNHEISYIEKEFETIYQSLELIKIADEDQILNYHTIAFVSNDDTSLERVKKIIRKQDNKTKWIKEFSVALKKSFSSIVEIQNSRDSQSTLADILYLDQYNSFPLLLKLFHFHQDIDSIQKALRFLEIILFKMSYTVGNYRTNRLHSIALNYNNNLQNLENELLDKAKNGFKDYWNFTGDFHRCLNGGYHYWSITKYLLWKYENKLRENEREPSMKYSDFANLFGKHKLENTIDHWTPQKPDGIEYTQEFKDNFLNNIGNLVLSTRGRNSSDSNNLPSNRETKSVLIQRQKLEPLKNSWTELEIKNRQIEIVTFAINHWDPNKL
ncbi:DUF262 domain-containing protein [Flavobacterium chilense]|uniref:Uncharacterized conserved protein, contains ParB-like and HNH nuclease domains n=1 Tax=Flavobacterium chilense TaxID=946677 RepID=A0A1M7JQN0_9FLAO|nr:DUF262 domain-containing protein [Flavobacterium chilense]SHM55215.1 Uncharacterized conserved protein, contains ParB-like and HNH nuclease domains [Flavobacterium chilense]